MVKNDSTAEVDSNLNSFSGRQKKDDEVIEKDVITGLGKEYYEIVHTHLMALRLQKRKEMPAIPGSAQMYRSF